MREFWANPIDETLKRTERLARLDTRHEYMTEWLSTYAHTGPTTSNQGVDNVPFQRWFHFKEAFSPKFVADSLGSLPYRVDRCLDPFLGSGTTALTCRMLGISCEGVEVNPFLADLIEAKLTPIKLARFRSTYEKLIKDLKPSAIDYEMPAGMPKTLVEPGVADRFVFTREIYGTCRAIVRLSRAMPPADARLLRVLVGSVLVENSNVTINGKGRRYRSNWSNRKRTPSDLIKSLDEKVDIAVDDLSRYSGLALGSHTIHRGDARRVLASARRADVAIFSPPYPNSFDYTDVYNLELWMLGYLGSTADNRTLRQSTLRSHVQTKWTFTSGGTQSASLATTIRELESKRSELWNRNIPEMVECYFQDLNTVFFQLRNLLKPGHHAIIAIGDSQYAGIYIDVATILAECIKNLGFRLVKKGAIRSMRNSSQHGGKYELAEHCLVFELARSRKGMK